MRISAYIFLQNVDKHWPLLASSLFFVFSIFNHLFSLNTRLTRLRALFIISTRLRALTLINMGLKANLHQAILLRLRPSALFYFINGAIINKRFGRFDNTTHLNFSLIADAHSNANYTF